MAFLFESSIIDLGRQRKAADVAGRQYQGLSTNFDSSGHDIQTLQAPARPIETASTLALPDMLTFEHFSFWLYLAI